MPFPNPVVGGGGALVRAAIHSPNYVPATTGWSINQDGSADFHNVTLTGGSLVVTTSGQGVFVYAGTPATGNLIVSIASAAGTDAHANAYPKGIGVAGTGQITVGATGKPQILLDTSNVVSVPGIQVPGAQAVLTTGSATEAHPGAISSGSSGGTTDQGLTVVNSPIFAPTSGGQVGASNFGTLELLSSAKDSSQNASATLAVVGGYPTGAAASSITCNMDGSITLNGFPAQVLGDVLADGAVILTDTGFSRSAGAAKQATTFGFRTIVHVPTASLPNATRPTYVDENGRTADLTRPAAAWPPELSGFQAWTGDPMGCYSTSANSLTHISVNAFWVPGACTLTELAMFMLTNGAGLTAGQSLLGLYTGQGARIAVTPDQSAAWDLAATEGPVTASFTSAATINGPDWYYAALLANGTTAPTWLTHSQLGTTVGAANTGFPLGAARSMRTTATFTTLPATLPAFNSTNWTSNSIPFWFGAD